MGGKQETEGTQLGCHGLPPPAQRTLQGKPGSVSTASPRASPWGDRPREGAAWRPRLGYFAIRGTTSWTRPLSGSPTWRM